MAEKENRLNISAIYGLIFGILDMITAVFFIFPLYGQEDKDYIRMVTLFSNTTISAPIKTIYYVLLTSLTVFGAVELFIQNSKDDKKINLCKTGSILLHALTITFFAMSQQPYVTVFLFMLFMVKVVLLIKKNGMK